MAIRNIEASIECDGCGSSFAVELDPADTLDDGAVSICDYVEDIIAGLPWCSIQGDHWLCKDCTRKVDAAFEDDDPDPTHEQVAAVLNKAGGGVMSLPDHLIPIEPAEPVHVLCDHILGLDLPYGVRLEAQAFRETRTPHDARRLANALRHVMKLPDLADVVLGLGQKRAE